MRHSISLIYKPIFFKVSAIVWALVIFVLTVIPIDAAPKTFQGSDKLAHLIIFSVLSFLVSGSIQKKSRNYLLVAALLSVTFGTCTELLQNVVPGRKADIYDLIFNVIGSLIGLYLFKIYRKKFLK